MNKVNVRVYFTQGYAGSVNGHVTIGDERTSTIYAENEGKSEGVTYVLELEHVSELLEKMITENGYTIAQSKRQKYPRLIINE